MGFILEETENKTKWEDRDGLQLPLGYSSQITALLFYTTAGPDLSYSEHGKGDFICTDPQMHVANFA